jgi:hypothetical protein
MPTEPKRTKFLTKSKPNRPTISTICGDGIITTVDGEDVSLMLAQRAALVSDQRKFYDCGTKHNIWKQSRG